MDTKIANPGPLGLSGFALTTLILSLINAGIIGSGNVSIVIGLALFYGGIAQFAAGMWEFRTGNTFGAAAFTSYGAFWLSFAALYLPGIQKDLGLKADNQGIGWYLIGWAIVTGLFMLGTFRINGGLVGVFVALFITFLLLGFGALGGDGGKSLTQIGGYVGIVTAILAWYVALAGILSAVSGGKWNLPVFPMGG